ncbi:alpha/beta fold hydrolase [Aquabacterium sp. A7-Y]|uniref:thioesterase II family protein n=1 Tax=Aquabacterium sp. A7-Y TaxID=1349605 RepID=UPI00223DD07F|nr:alpha/beta fold hydrolase [Aquabacterium sp. A7-Y]MCW7537073.1 alpha/beta fold hydrolase [Aquabacterium sp. A7-Y]
MQHRWFSLLGGARAPQVRLYCLPYAGAGHTIFRPWGALVSDALELALVKLPGRGERYREPRPATLAGLADSIADAIAAEAPHRFALFGHSMGALMAFEVARRLSHDLGRPPEALFVSGRRAPGSPASLAPLLQLDDAGFLRHVHAMGGFPDELLANQDAVDYFLPILRADFAWCEQHRDRPRPPLPCPIVVYGGRDDSTAPPALLQGWAGQSSAGCRIELYDGGHFFLFPQQDGLLRSIQQSLGLAV